MAKVMVQVFYEGDLPYVPSVIHDPLEVSSAESTVLIRLPSSHPTKKITAIKFLFITDNGTADVSVTNLRTE